MMMSSVAGGCWEEYSMGGEYMCIATSLLKRLYKNQNNKFSEIF
jgi:hypothetical protein